ncbi:MAG: hypothetical protein A2W31_14880 [Planctomycetes bacterium RBG_16_64_10]|nr:MAG: hypothetical protein A2W31_14880 [Planctomycetes bacterium RBG_16_64_10]
MMLPTARGTNRPRILLVRLSAIGDVIHATPVLCALRARLPHAWLAWVVEGRAGDLIEGHRALDELVRLPRRWLKSPRAVWALRQRLRALDLDIALDVQGLTKSAVAARLSGAPRRIGFGGADGRELSPWLNTELVVPRSTHIVDRNLELLRPLGIENPAVAFDLPAPAQDAQQMDEYLRRADLTDGFAVINPGAGWPSKRWSAPRFGAVARHLGTEHRLPTLVVWAGDEERALAQQVAATAAGHGRLAPATTLTELAALVRRARLLVASDTGPLHLAVAVNTPVVGLFGPMPRERNGPYGPRHIALQQMVLQGGSRARRRATNDAMLAIAVDQVCAACDMILRRDG